MHSFLVLMCPSLFTLITSIPIFNAGDEKNPNFQPESSSLYMVDNLAFPQPDAVSPKTLNLDNGNQFDSLLTNDEQVADSSLSDKDEKPPEIDCDFARDRKMREFCWVFIYKGGMLSKATAVASLVLMELIMDAIKNDPPESLQREALRKMRQSFLQAHVPVTLNIQLPESHVKEGTQSSNTPRRVSFDIAKMCKRVDPAWLQKTIETAMVTLGSPLTGELLSEAASGIATAAEALPILLLF